MGSTRPARPLAAAAAMAAVLAAAFAPLAPAAQAHTVDAVGEYRIEIGWMTEPVVSGETNGIELYIGKLEPCPSIEAAMDCAASQEFAGGVEGLEDDIEVQLVYGDDKIWLPLSADHNIAGKYYAFVNPTESGYYQANLIGAVGEASLSLSMHPPRVDDREYIEFPAPADAAVRKIAAEQVDISGDLDSIRAELDGLAGRVGAAADAAADAAAAAADAAAAAADARTRQDAGISYAGVGLGIAGLAAGGAALAVALQRRR